MLIIWIHCVGAAYAALLFRMRKIASIFLQLCRDWLLKWLTHVCVGRFLIKVHQVVWNLLQWAVLNVWAAAASVLLTRQQAWLHQGHQTKGRCSWRIPRSFRLLLICIALWLLLDINLDVLRIHLTHFLWCEPWSKKWLTNGQKGANLVKNIKCLITYFGRLNTMNYWWHYFLFRYHSYLDNILFIQ